MAGVAGATRLTARRGVCPWPCHRTNWCDAREIWSAGPTISGAIFDRASRTDELATLEARISDPAFWNNQAEAQKVLQRRRRLADDVALRDSLKGRVDDLGVLLECMRRTANADARPTWTPGDEFEKAR